MANRTMIFVLGVIAVLVGIGFYSWYSGNNSAQYAMDMDGMSGIEPAAGEVSPTLLESTTIPDGAIALSNLGSIPGITDYYAENEQECTTAPWHVQDTRVVTNGKISCDLQSLKQQGVSYTVIVQCGPDDLGTPEVWEMSQPTSDTLVVARPGGLPVTLIRCGVVGS